MEIHAARVKGTKYREDGSLLGLNQIGLSAPLIKTFARIALDPDKPLYRKLT